MGAQPATLAGLAGMGDLVRANGSAVTFVRRLTGARRQMLTCYGPLSRNRTVGRLLGEGKTMEQIRSLQTEVAEGVFTAAAAQQLCAQLGLDLPIINAVADILEGKITAQVASGAASRARCFTNATYTL